MKGSDFVQQMKSVPNADLDGIMLKYLLDEANVPSFLQSGAPMMRVTSEAVIDGMLYTAYTLHKRNYLALGNDDDYMLAPLSEVSAQAWCDAKRRHWYIPPKLLVKRTWAQSDCKIMPQVISRNGGYAGDVAATGLSVVWAEQQMINAAMRRKGCSLTASCRAKKAYITAPNVDGASLHFTGWYTDGTPGFIEQDPVTLRPAYAVNAPGPWGWGWQDGGTRPVDAAPHPARFADYAHGVDLVFYATLVNGLQFDFADVCSHPKLHVLVSDQGPFVPVFPNAQAKPASASFAMPSGTTPPSNFTGAIYRSTKSGGVELVRAGVMDGGASGAGSGAIEPSGGWPVVPLIIGGIAVGLLVATLAISPTSGAAGAAIDRRVGRRVRYAAPGA